MTSYVLFGVVIVYFLRFLVRLVRGPQYDKVIRKGDEPVSFLGTKLGKGRT